MMEFLVCASHFSPEDQFKGQQQQQQNIKIKI